MVDLGPKQPHFVHRLIIATVETSLTGEVLRHGFMTVEIESEALTRALFTGVGKASVIGCESRRG
jgi:hypothetical protein